MVKKYCRKNWRSKIKNSGEDTFKIMAVSVIDLKIIFMFSVTIGYFTANFQRIEEWIGDEKQKYRTSYIAVLGHPRV